MSDRLRHLQRQQALLREHLAWLDSEIARESNSGVAAASAPTTTPPALPDIEADALLEKYASEERQNPADIRRGCFIAFASAISLFVAGVAALWLLFYR